MEAAKGHPLLTSDGKVSHFRIKEFFCKCDDCSWDKIAQPLLDVLEAMRVACGPIHVVSGIRCETHNRMVGGAPNSLHVPRLGVGMAADVSSRILPPEHLAILGARYLGESGGIGLYSSWVHFDIRDYRAFWVGT